jgi:hypothetical protein
MKSKGTGTVVIAIAFLLVACNHDEKGQARLDQSERPTQTAITKSADPRDIEPIRTAPAIEEHDPKSLDTAKWLGELADVASVDLARAVKLAEAIPDAKLQRMGVARIAIKLCADRLDRMPELLASLKSVELRATVVSALASEWAVKDPRYAFEFASKALTGVDKNTFMHRSAARIVGNEDFETAAALVGAMPFSDSRSSIVFRLANTWSAKDVSAAYQWAMSLPLPEDRRTALSEIARAAAAAQDMATLVNIANDSADRELQNSSIGAIIQVVTTTGQAEEAIEWIGKLPKGLQPQAQAQLVASVGGSDVEKWTAYALRIPDTGSANNAIWSLAAKAFERSPSEATRWVQKLPEQVQDSAISAIVHRWYDTDSIALSEWINSLPTGRQRDKSLEVLADRLSGTDVAAAKEVAAKIRDADARNRITKYLTSIRP